MPKIMPDATANAYLAKIATGSAIRVCSTLTTGSTYANVVAATLATTSMTTGLGNGDYTATNDTSGRKVTMTQQSNVAISAAGTANHVALTESATSTILYVTTCTSQALATGGTVTIPAWKVNIQDPT